MLFPKENGGGRLKGMLLFLQKNGVLEAFKARKIWTGKFVGGTLASTLSGSKRLHRVLLST